MDDQRPEDLAAAARARLDAAVQGDEPQPAAGSAPVQKAAETPDGDKPAPWSLSGRGIDLEESAEAARQMGREERHAQQSADGWRTRADELLHIGDDNTAGPAEAIERPSDVRTAKQYGQMSRQAVSVINKYFADSDVSELHINAPDRIFAKYKGERVQVGAEFSSIEEYNRFVEDLIVRADTHETLDGFKRRGRGVVRMAGGDRMAIMFPPISEFAQLAIHKVVARTWDLSNLVRNETMTQQMANFLVAAVRAKTNVLVVGEMGSGKAQPIDAKVLTPQGWKMMGELSVGDEVIGGDGLPTRITGVFSQGEKEIFRVTFSDGSSTECCDEHLWEVQTPLRKWRGAAPQVKSLAEIRGSLFDSAGNAKWFVPMVEPVELAERDVPLDPYLLGCMLGDGSIVQGTPRFTTADDELLVAVGDALPDGCSIGEQQAYTAYITGPGVDRRQPIADRRNPMTQALRDLDVYGHGSESKFVPHDYKFNGIEVRLGVLQGLFDTDGSANGSGIDFCTRSSQLAQDVVFLVQSLGGRARINKRDTGYRNQTGDFMRCSPSYRVYVRLPRGIQPFRLKRKLSAYRPGEKYQPTRAIVAVEAIGRKPAQCIMVDSPRHLYVTDDFIVTHNTVMLSLLAQQIGEDERVALIEEVPEVFLDKPDVSRFTYYPDVEDGPKMGLPEILDTVLYMRMDRVIIGEIHDQGMYRMLRVMAAGSDGSLSTFHAGSVDQALAQVRNHVILEHPQMPSAVAADFIRQAVNLVVVVERVRGKHRVVELAEVEWRNLTDASDTLGKNVLFQFDRDAADENGQKVGRFVTVSRPDEKGKILQKAEKYGVPIDPAWFEGIDLSRRGSR